MPRPGRFAVGDPNNKFPLIDLVLNLFLIDSYPSTGRVIIGRVEYELVHMVSAVVVSQRVAKIEEKMGSSLPLEKMGSSLPLTLTDIVLFFPYLIFNFSATFFSLETLW